MICDLCGRKADLTRHHLLPKSQRSSFKHKLTEAELDATAWLCEDCHGFINQVLRAREMAKHYRTLEALRGHPKIAAFIRWVAKRPADRRVQLKLLKRHA